MYKTQKYVKRFNLSNNDEVSEYEAILNNPNAQILDRVKEKISDRDMDPETGRVISIKDHLELIVTWQERTLL
jgi:hypothetical protein